MKFTISIPSDFSFLETVSAHGWRRLLPFVWDEDTQTLVRTEDIGGGQVAVLTIGAGQDGVSITTDIDCDQTELTHHVRRMLQIDLPLTEFHAYCQTIPEIAHLVECKRGRMLRSPTLFEDTVKVIATSNTTWAQTIQMTARIVAEFGPAGRTFPSAAQIADVPFDEFAFKARMGYRNAYVYAIATAITAGTLDLEAWQSEPMTALELRKRLLSLPGIGPYGAACLMLYLGKPEHVNADSVARTLLAGELGRPVTDKEVLAFFEVHGEWRGLIYNFYPWKQ
ncbi:MAG: DNA-3-methyladenine glycosylase family protein [Janthinobacterium lividum]